MSTGVAIKFANTHAVKTDAIDKPLLASADIETYAGLECGPVGGVTRCHHRPDRYRRPGRRG